jgi:hypothetical protein
MPQITKGDTFADGQQVTGTRLNQLIDSAVITSSVILDQTNLTANTVASGDSVLLYDLSATALREATASDLLNSNISVVTSSITAGANSDITLTPNDGALVTGATYTSTDGLTVRVTLNSHGLVVNQVIIISGAGTGYNGTFRITAVAANTFDYVMTTAATPATNVSCIYTRQGTVRNSEHEVIGGNLYVNGDAVITGTIVQNGGVTNTGNVSIAGNLIVTGTTTQTGTVTQNGAVNQTGTVNITGAIQYNGTPVYALYEITEQNMSWSQGTGTMWTSSSFTKPADEIWEFEFSGFICNANNGTSNINFTKSDGSTSYFNINLQYFSGSSTSNYLQMSSGAKWIVLSGIALTSETVKLIVASANIFASTGTNKLFIKKYKTA